MNNPLKAGLVDWKFAGVNWDKIPGTSVPYVLPATWKVTEFGDSEAAGMGTGAWRARAADFVTLDTASGIVHVVLAYGADDYALGQKEGLPVIQLVGSDGRRVAGCGAFVGRFCKEADSDIIRDLENARPAPQARKLQTRLSILLALQKSTDLFRARRLVHPHQARNPGRHRQQPKSRLAPRAHQRRSLRQLS